ncbi:MAG: M23 family metallopeptidase [Dermatophilaceae bacterium]
MATWRWTAPTGGRHTASGARFSRGRMAGAAGAALAVGLLVPTTVGLIESQASQDPPASVPFVAAPAALTQVSLTRTSPGAIGVLFGLGHPATNQVAPAPAAPPDLAGAPDLGAVPVAAVDPASVLASGFVRPVEGPITSRFGPRFHPILKVWKLHTGTDIGAACGTPVKAVKDGTVTSAGVAGGDGNRVVIDHGHGLASTYNHLSAYAATVGLQVRQGQVIGYVGTTGLSTGCHLHFEVMVNGVLVDSGPYLDLAPAPTVTIPAAVAAVSVAPAAPARSATTPAASAPPPAPAAPAPAASSTSPAPATTSSTSPAPPGTTSSSSTTTTPASCPTDSTSPGGTDTGGSCPPSTRASSSTSTKSARSASSADAASATSAVAPS